jgi:hypothetical protein
MHNWSGWSCTGTIFTAIGAIFTVASFGLMVCQALRPQWFPFPPTPPPSAEATRQAATLQRERVVDRRLLRGVAEGVRELTRALVPAVGTVPETLWGQLRDGSMTEKEILTALKDILIAQRDILDSRRSNGALPHLLLLILLQQQRRTGLRPRGPRRRRLQRPGVVKVRRQSTRSTARYSDVAAG